MIEDLKKMTADTSLATARVNDWLDRKLRTKTETAKILDMARSTLDYKLNDHSWNYKEIELICMHFSY